MRMTLLCAQRNGGKTSHILSHYSGQKGFATVSPDRSKLSLFLLDLETGERRLLMYRKDPEVPYDLVQETFDWANSRMMRLDSGLLVLDECGWMDLEGRAFAPALHHIRSCHSLSAILSVRTSFVEDYRRFFTPEEVEVISL